MKGDFTNMTADLDLNLSNLAGNLVLPTTPGSTPTGTPTGGLPSLPGLPLPTGSSTSYSSSSSSGGVLCPPVCVAPERDSGSGSDGSWRSLYYGGAA
jgi:phospholipid/cholesterol/gamma-HCH transport system substrate-binding protein